MIVTFWNTEKYMNPKDSGKSPITDGYQVTLMVPKQMDKDLGAQQESTSESMKGVVATNFLLTFVLSVSMQ